MRDTARVCSRLDPGKRDSFPAVCPDASWRDAEKGRPIGTSKPDFIPRIRQSRLERIKSRLDAVRAIPRIVPPANFASGVDNDPLIHTHAPQIGLHYLFVPIHCNVNSQNKKPDCCYYRVQIIVRVWMPVHDTVPMFYITFPLVAETLA